MSSTLSHLLDVVLPCVAEYDEAEVELTAAVETSDVALRGEAEKKAKRRGAACAVAIDGLTDRAALEFGLSKTKVREKVGALCTLPNGSNQLREHSLRRLEAIAVAHKHEIVSNPNLPLRSNADVLACGAGWGIDAWGVGKYGGVELLAHTVDGATHKVLGDVPAAVNGWVQFLRSRGVRMPGAQRMVCGLTIEI